MTAVAKRLDESLQRWSPSTAREVTVLINEIIELADNDCLDVMRSRHIEQEVLTLIDERS